ncbi:MAG: M48 family metalloprotease [Comamonadaceae bacterium]|nr:M48 family metalloprotease [Comamonadaceae bacterium]
MNLAYRVWIFILVFLILNLESSFAVQKGGVSQVQMLDYEAQQYKNAEVDLGPRFYQAYRIAERLARANNLDNYAWRIVMPKETEYDINAHATQANVIVLDSGVTDNFLGEVSVLAFVIAHEMAHHVYKHMPKQQRQLDKIQSEIKSYGIQVEPPKINVLGRNFEQSPEASYLNYGIYYFVLKQKQEELSKIKERISSLELDLYSEMRDHEYQADRAAIIYMAKAGFNPKDALRFLIFLKDCQ